VNGHGSIPKSNRAASASTHPRVHVPDCQGLGFRLEFDPALVVPNQDLSLSQGAVNGNGWNFDDTPVGVRASCADLADVYKFKMDTPWRKTV